MTTSAVLLTGGTGRRLGGVAKAGVRVGGRTLLDRVVEALAADETVVVGERRPTERAVRWCREDPPGGGPAAGLMAGVAALAPSARIVRVAAVDLALVTPETFARLEGALGGADGALLVDAEGRRQPLCAAYRVDALRRAAASYGDLAGRSLRSVLAPLELVEVPAVGHEALDVDTPADLDAVRRLLP